MVKERKISLHHQDYNYSLKSLRYSISTQEPHLVFTDLREILNAITIKFLRLHCKNMVYYLTLQSTLLFG